MQVRTATLAASLCVLIASTGSASVTEKTANINGTAVRYKVVLPPAYDAAKTYPAILAFPPGSQDMSMVDATLNGNFRAQAECRDATATERARQALHPYVRGRAGFRLARGDARSGGEAAHGRVQRHLFTGTRSAACDPNSDRTGRGTAVRSIRRRTQRHVREITRQCHPRRASR